VKAPRPNARVYFALIGDGPWSCFFCKDSVLSIGQDTYDGNVHHIDGDPFNNELDNLAVAHTLCHQRHHSPTEEQKKQISSKLKGRPSPTKGMKFSPEINARKAQCGPANGMYGKTINERTKLAVSTANKRSAPCDRCGQDIALRWMDRHLAAGCPMKRIIVINGVERVRGKLPKSLCSACGKPYAERWMQRHKDEGRCTDS